MVLFFLVALIRSACSRFSEIYLYRSCWIYATCASVVLTVGLGMVDIRDYSGILAIHCQMSWICVVGNEYKELSSGPVWTRTPTRTHGIPSKCYKIWFFLFMWCAVNRWIRLISCSLYNIYSFHVPGFDGIANLVPNQHLLLPWSIIHDSPPWCLHPC